MKFKICIFFIIVLFIFSHLNAESVINENSKPIILKGVNLFWSAQFNEAIDVLKDAIAHYKLSNDELFLAYLYMGFSHVRLDSAPETIDEIFRKAIYINPKLKPDPEKIPPDLHNRFLNVHQQIVGAVYIVTEPANADIIGYCDALATKITGKSPLLVKDIIAAQYEFNVKLKGYKNDQLIINLSPATTDTLNFNLISQKHFIKNKWVLLLGSTAVVTSAVAYYLLQDESEQQPESNDLPFPPERP